MYEKLWDCVLNNPHSINTEGHSSGRRKMIPPMEARRHRKEWKVTKKVNYNNVNILGNLKYLKIKIQSNSKIWKYESKCKLIIDLINQEYRTEEGNEINF